jgi:hypothetical protein
MSEAINPTSGPWRVFDPDMEGRTYGISAANGDAVVFFGSDENEGIRLLDDARLIAEAGTVHHETGLTPRQLVERVKELEEATVELLRWLPTAAEMRAFNYHAAAVERARHARHRSIAALSKPLPNTVAEVK